MTTVDAAIAANRFGLGARPGELAALGAHARDALLAQLEAPPPLLDAAMPGSRELLAKVLAERTAQRDKRKESAQKTVAVARAIREIYQPAYVADVLARFNAAVVSQRSFAERLVHFWSNHFAVSVDKVAVLGLAGTLEREAIRPHVLGNFADMLLAVEQHPAMLLFLDNQQSMGSNSQAARAAGKRGRDTGLNENLGREILELHTLGVDGGYTQADVRSFATMITGWSIGGEGGRGGLRGGEPGQFFFREAFHEPGAAMLLGKRYAEGGVEQGVAALRDLAASARTAGHLAAKLVRHFIADEPPASAVDAVAAAYLKSGGNLASMYRALIAVPQAWKDPLSKFKTPSDYIFSTWRALSLPAVAQSDLRVFEDLGQRNFQPGSPAGWPDRSADWDGSAALMKRLEWAQGLSQKLGTRQNAQALADEALGATLSLKTGEAIARAADGSQAMALLLCSPEFMRR